MNSYLEKLKKEIRLKRYSYRTEQAYLGWVKRYLMFLNKEQIKGNYEVKIVAFLNYLTEHRSVAASTQNQALCSLIFFYEHILNINIGSLANLSYASKKANLPVVLSEHEAKRIIQYLNGVKKLIVSILYGSGLRISECLRLRILDIDFDYHQIEIRNSKGNKDRVSILPESIAGELKNQIKKVEMLHQKDTSRGFGHVLLPNALSVKYPNASSELKWQYLFPSRKIGNDPRTGFRHRYHQSAQAVNRAIKQAVNQSGIQKKVSAHTFRHSFATHLLKNGYDIRTVQELLGHNSVKTTMIYTHVLNRGGHGVKSPLDT
jgi:integron integrase